MPRRQNTTLSISDGSSLRRRSGTEDSVPGTLLTEQAMQHLFQSRSRSVRQPELRQERMQVLVLGSLSAARAAAKNGVIAMHHARRLEQKRFRIGPRPP